jgi:hypothetical protein
MEKNKYYTPDITEFCVGFEFEFQGLDNYWNPTGWEKVRLNIDESRNFGLYTLKHIKSVLEDKEITCIDHIRVKYLDEQDVLDLGWTKTEDKCPHTDKNYFVINEDYGFDIRTTHKIILYQNGSLHYMWEYNSSYNTSEGQMMINIKNKTELKKIMYQLNINYGI